MKKIFLLFLPLIIFARVALALPKSGVQIIPLSEMSVSENDKKKLLNELKLQKINGYIEDSPNEVARQLFHTQKMFLMRKLKVENFTSNPHDTGMKKNLSQLKLAFIFKGVPGIEPQNIIGFSVQGMWKNGWTGVREIFSKQELGVCDFNLFNLALTQGGESIAAEFVSYEVNNKPTTISIRGSKKAGFLYSIGWSDNRYSYGLECANEKFDAAIKNTLINLALTIDHSMVAH